MIGHANVRLMMYEYLQDGLSPSERSEVEAHLNECKECTTELRSLSELIALFPLPTTRASEERPEQYWNQFASRIELKISNQKRMHSNQLADVVEWIEGLFFLRPKYTYAIGGALILMVVAFAFRTFLPHDGRDVSSGVNNKSKRFEHITNPVTSGNEHEFAVPNERVSQYFRTSKTLLVGLANLRTDQEELLDFTTERRVSRDLIREARYLKQQPIDPRSRELMNNLERILVELGNIKEKNDLPNVEIIRGGIHQENLLFKIRMAEAMYDSTRFVSARYNQ